MPIYAAAIQAGASVYEGYQKRKENQRALKMAESEKRAARGFLDEAGSRDAFLQALQESQLKAGHKRELAGFEGARRATSLGADAARRTVLNQGQRMQADATQGLISRGLIGTSAGTGAATDLAGQTTAQLAAIDQQLAAAFADLGLQESSLEGEQADELAALIGSGRQFQQQLGTLRTEFAPTSGVSSGQGNFFKKLGFL